MFRLTTCLILVATSGCVIVEPRVTNPLPNVTRVAVVPFANHSVEPAVDTVLVTNAYYAELQKTPGFEVVPIGITAKAIEDFGLRMASPRDALELARVLDVDAVVVGAVTDFDPYSPPRIGWHVEWYSPHSPEFARGVPVEPGLRPDIPPLPERSDDCEEPTDEATDGPHCEPKHGLPAHSRRRPVNRTAGRSTRWDLGGTRGAHVRGQSPDSVNDAFFADDLVEGEAVRNAIPVPIEVEGEGLSVDPWSDAADRPLGMQKPEPLFPGQFPDLRAIDDPPYPFEEPLEPAPVDSSPVQATVVDPDPVVDDPQPAPRVAESVEQPGDSFEPFDFDSPPSPTRDEDVAPPVLPPPTEPAPEAFEALQPPPRRPSSAPVPGPGTGEMVVPFDAAAVRRAMSLPYDPQRPIMAYTRVFDAKDQDLLARLRDYYELNGDERAGGWRGYLQRSEDFIRFTAHVAIVEMLTLHGGETRRRYVWKFRTRS